MLLGSLFNDFEVVKRAADRSYTKLLKTLSLFILTRKNGDDVFPFVSFEKLGHFRKKKIRIYANKDG
jgi:hypothetical protein